MFGERARLRHAAEVEHLLASVVLHGDNAGFDRLVKLLRKTVAELSPDHVDLPRELCNLATVLQVRFARLREPQFLVEAVEVARRSLDSVAEDHSEYAVHLSTLGAALAASSVVFGVPDELDQAIELQRRAAEHVRCGDPYRATVLGELADALHVRGERDGDPEDVDSALSCLTRAMVVPAISSAQALALQSQRGRLHLALFSLRAQAGDAELAVDAYQSVADLTRSGDPAYPSRVRDVSRALLVSATATWDLTSLDDAIRSCQRIDAAVQGGRSAEYLLDFGAAVLKRYDLAGEFDDVESAILFSRAAIETLPPWSLLLSRAAGVLADALLARFRINADREDLDEAIDRFRWAVDVCPPRSSKRAKLLHSLGTSLEMRYSHQKDAADLAEATEVFRGAVESSKPWDPSLWEYRLDVAHVLRRRRALGQIDISLPDLVDLYRAAAQHTPAGHPARAEVLTEIGAVLRWSYVETGELAKLREAVVFHREALSLAGEDNPVRGKVLTNLGMVYEVLHLRTEDERYLTEAIGAYREALETLPPGRSDRTWELLGVGSALLDRYQLRKTWEDLTEAVNVLGQAAGRVSPEDPLLGLLVSRLGDASVTAFEHTRELVHLDHAIEVYRAALVANAGDEQGLGRVQSAFGYALRLRYTTTGDVAALDEAILLGRESVRLSEEHYADHVLRRAHLGTALMLRAVTAPGDGTGEFHDEGMAVLAEAVRSETDFSGYGIYAGRLLAEWAARTQDWRTAADALAAAMDLLPQSVWLGMDRAQRENRLARWQGMASRAAAFALASGDVRRAVELLEHGRAVLWSQMLQIRSDFADLRAQDPHLAEQLSEVARQLADARTAVGYFDPGTGRLIEPDSLRGLEHRTYLAEEWHRLAETARTLPGLEYLLRIPPLEALQSGLPDGAVVIVNVDDLRCDAIIVTRTACELVELPRLSGADVSIHADRFADALKSREKAPLVHETLEWLWEAVAEPVLARLESLRIPHDRIWWCPTGPLTVLPLHAAGRHAADDGSTVLDRTVSSYTPTLRLLAHGRAEDRAHPERTMLVVGLPETPALPGRRRMKDLKWVEHEAARVAPRFPHRSTTRIGTEANRAAVLADLQEHAYVHFACHGLQNLEDPSNASIELHDGKLTVADIAELRLRGAALGFLSACHTAAGSGRLPDEAIHLAAALRMSGYQHVVGTLWFIYDVVAPDVADTVYEIMTESGDLDLTKTARALHAAVLELRERDLNSGNPRGPAVWAQYVHIGR
ncbi:CHAT domain-containing protein [Lentzea sp. JNUCC 0626]|uniref:CHAT domain-containing protein n=1 Tax=Lentzea sp. JNUCC 0626 TaxID=3367513 RepID=UPI0037490024